MRIGKLTNTDRVRERISCSLNILHTGPGVYLVCLRKQVLYVGYGQNLAKRCTQPDFSSERRYDALGKCDRIELYPCDSVAQAQQLEAELISLYQPKHNSVGCYTIKRRQPPTLCTGPRLKPEKNRLPVELCTFAHLQAQHAKLFEGVA